MLFSSVKKCSQITLVLSLFLVAPSITFADDEIATRDALLLLAEGRRSEALEQLEFLAEEGNHFAQLELGSLYLVGHFVPVDLAKHEAYFTAAREGGNELAMYFDADSSTDLAKLQSLLDQGVEIASCQLRVLDPELNEVCNQAVRQLAAKGSQDALYWLKVEVEDPLADALVKEFPHPTAIAEIAWTYWRTEPTKELLAQLVKVHELGSVRAPLYIISAGSEPGAQLERDRLIADLPDQTKASLRVALRSSIDGEHAGWFGSEWFAGDTLGQLYERGNVSLGIAPDYGLAFDAYENCSASEKEISAGMCFYEQARLKRSGGPNLEQSTLEALSLFDRGSSKGDSASSVNLARMFLAGDGLAQNWERAAFFFQRALDQGNFYAAKDLADMYRDGLGVDKDLEKAASFYEISVVGDGHDSFEADINAMLALADMNEAGDIEGASPEEANRWFKKAIDRYEGWTSWLGFKSPDLLAVAIEGFDRTKRNLKSPSLDSISPDTGIIESEAFGNYVALIIANESYQDLVDLETPRADALLVGETLQEHFNADVEYLFNATRAQMLRTLNRYRENLQPSDNFILYYAGHGFYDEELNVYYWQPIESAVDEDFTWVDTERIQRTIYGFKSRNALIIADSCFSGAVVRGNELVAAESNDQEALLALSMQKSRIALTSGGLQPVLDSTGNSKTSTFASNLVDALRAVDRPMPIYSIFPTVRSSVTAETAAWGFEQVPEIGKLFRAGHDGGDFILSPHVPGRE